MCDFACCGANRGGEVLDAPTVNSSDGSASLATIYVLGGTGSSEGMSQLMSVELLEVKSDLSTSTWQEGVKMRTARLGACGACVGGALHIVGGWNGNHA